MIPFTTVRDKFLKLRTKVIKTRDPGRQNKAWSRLVWLVSQVNEVTEIRLYKIKSTKTDNELSFVYTEFVEGFDDPQCYLSERKGSVQTLYEEKFPHRSYWTYEDLNTIYSLPANSSSIQKAYDVAMKVVRYRLGIVCGPITTGGGSVEENLRIFNKTILKISSAEESIIEKSIIFSQIPFEPLFKKISENEKYDSKYHYRGQEFLDKFYIPLFISGRIERAYFIYGWTLSCGASQERGAIVSYNKWVELYGKDEGKKPILVVDLPEDFLEK